MWGMGQGWPANPIAEVYHLAQPSDVETLLESGSIDFMNPPQDATEKLAPVLSNGQQVILKEFGHGNSFWNSQPEAREQLLTTYFATGEVDASGYTYQPPDFDVGGGLPGLARTALIIATVLIIVLLALVPNPNDPDAGFGSFFSRSWLLSSRGAPPWMKRWFVVTTLVVLPLKRLLQTLYFQRRTKCDVHSCSGPW